jgi:hypothetical protein
VLRLKIRGGFGRHGTGCREFRRLDRACGETLLLVDLSVGEAAQVVKDCIAGIRDASDASPAEREGIAGWEDDWRQDHQASPPVVRVIVDAMARYLAHLRSRGSSPRTRSGVRSDLNAAGHLVLMYDAPKGHRIRQCFDGQWSSSSSAGSPTARPYSLVTAGASRFASFLPCRCNPVQGAAAIPGIYGNVGNLESVTY